MKLIILLISFYNHSGCSPVTDTIPAVKSLIYRVTIHTQSNGIKTGYLVRFTDSTLLAAKKPYPFNQPVAEDSGFVKYPYPDIAYVEVRKKGAMGKGITIGALTGFLAGIIVGLVDGDDPPGILSMTAGEKAIIYGAGGIVVGGGVGAIVGAIKIKRFTIKGKKENFDKMRMSVMDRAYGTTSSKQ